MSFLGLLVLGFAPGLFRLWLIYQRDRYVPSPVSLVVRTFLWGVVVAAPIATIESLLTGFGYLVPDEPQSILEIAYVSFIVAGGVEEFGKYLVAQRTIYRSPYFLDPEGGLIYASAVALGLASIEKFVSMVSYGWSVILVRGPISTLGHVVFASLWGFALGRGKLEGLDPVTSIALGRSVGLHGLFDFLLLSGQSAWAFLLFLLGAALFVWLLRKAIGGSAEKHPMATVVVRCPVCPTRPSSGVNYCPACGQSLQTMAVQGAGRCSLCDVQVSPSHSFCGSCGSRLDRKVVRILALGRASLGPNDT